MVNYSPGSLDATFAALVDPTRRAILERLARGPSTPTALAEPFDVSLPAISKHLRVLEAAGLIARRREGRTHHCRLIPGPLNNAAAWVAHHRAFWEKQLDSLGEYLDRTAKKEVSRWQHRVRARKSSSASAARSATRGRRSSGRGRSRRH